MALPCGGACHQEMQSASSERLTVVRELTVLRGLRAINQEWLVALSIEILTAAAPFSSLVVVACFARDQRKEPSMRMRRGLFSHLKACLGKTWILSVSEAYKLVLNRNHRLLTLRAVAMVFSKLEWLAFPWKLIVTTITRC